MRTWGEILAALSIAVMASACVTTKEPVTTASIAPRAKPRPNPDDVKAAYWEKRCAERHREYQNGSTPKEGAASADKQMEDANCKRHYEQRRPAT